MTSDACLSMLIHELHYNVINYKKPTVKSTAAKIFFQVSVKKAHSVVDVFDYSAKEIVKYCR